MKEGGDPLTERENMRGGEGRGERGERRGERGEGRGERGRGERGGEVYVRSRRWPAKECSAFGTTRKNFSPSN